MSCVSSDGAIINVFLSSSVFFSCLMCVQYAVDDSLPFITNIVLAQLTAVLGTIIITCYGIPWFTAVLVPLAGIYYYTQHYYRKTSRLVYSIVFFSRLVGNGMELYSQSYHTDIESVFSHSEYFRISNPTFQWELMRGYSGKKLIFIYLYFLDPFFFLLDDSILLTLYLDRFP